ncbi:MAG: helix-turn-helix domain-containing protein [Defluviitaleaceae bacterium]|nr:helix-turn-helix domain-containing protein [Defluviitaleaceae bacterium]
MTFGEKVAALRKQRGFSQEELANMMIISRQAISRWEQGESIPEIENIVQLSTIFGVTTDYLLKDGEFTAVKVPPKGDTPVYPVDDEIKPALGLYDRLFNRGVIYILAAGMYLILGFGFFWWHPGWMIFAILGIIHGAVEAWRG